MAEDEDISRRYRELAREEPPRHLDDAIRAAARRAVHTRPAPLVVPTGRQHWYFPLAAAAIIVLAVAVTMHVEREQPGEEIVSAPAAPAGSPSAPQELMREEAQAEKPQPAAPERARKFEPGPRELRAQREAVPPAQDAVSNVQEPVRAEAAPKPVPPPPSTDSGAAGMVLGRVETPSSPAPAPAPQAVMPPRASAELRRADEAARQSSASAKLADAPAPEQWLQGIADLRRQGRHEEADKALAEFRKRYPDYRISKEMRETVERNRAK